MGHPPLFNVKGIHTHIKKYESFCNKRHCCKHMPGEEKPKSEI